MIYFNSFKYYYNEIWKINNKIMIKLILNQLFIIIIIFFYFIKIYYCLVIEICMYDFRF
jgi:hypothetical protein